MNSLHIGLVNNMPGPALEATERQFLRLLNAAVQDVSVTVSLLALPGISRPSERYSDIESLWNSGVDALIVTGREPRARNLKDEPFWRDFVNLLEWAERNTCSCIWSCLAAHAAVLRLDSIERSPSQEKLFGVFECEKIYGRGLAAGLPERFGVPHSRWNDLSAAELTASGYRMLTKSREVGADAFIKQRQSSLFLFFQGHPEYEFDTLWLEYRRDVRRFLRGEADAFPSTPRGYFDEDGREALAEFEVRAISKRREDLLAELPVPLPVSGIANIWRPAAVKLYRNWLNYLNERKSARTKARPVNLTCAYAQTSEAIL